MRRFMNSIDILPTETSMVNSSYLRKSTGGTQVVQNSIDAGIASEKSLAQN